MFPAAIVFDFDGTMVDTETAVYEAVRRTFADFGLELAPDAWMQAAGTMWGASWVDDLVDATGGAVDAHEARRRNRAHSAQINDRTVLRPGLQALLDEIRVPTASRWRSRRTRRPTGSSTTSTGSASPTTSLCSRRSTGSNGASPSPIPS